MSSLTSEEQEIHGQTYQVHRNMPSRENKEDEGGLSKRRMNIQAVLIHATTVAGILL